MFILGAYMIIAQRKQVVNAMEIFDWLDENDIEPFRDATAGVPPLQPRLLRRHHGERLWCDGGGKAE